LWPTLTGFADATRTDTGPGQPSSTYDLGGTVSWEIDVWGRIRSGAAAAQQNALMQQADERGVRQSLAAQVAVAWFTAIAAHEQVVINTDLLAVQQSTLRITARHAHPAARRARRHHRRLLRPRLLRLHHPLRRNHHPRRQIITTHRRGFSKAFTACYGDAAGASFPAPNAWR